MIIQGLLGVMINIVTKKDNKKESDYSDSFSFKTSFIISSL